MGKEVEKICLDRGHNIVAKFDNPEDWNSISDLKDTDVIIDFSLPDAAKANIIKAMESGIAMVTGTTGWYDELEDIEQICNENNGTLFYAPNFSLGVNIFFRANSYLAKLMSITDGYEVALNETHHIHKLDAPSGTAIETANGIIRNNSNYKGWSLENTDVDIIPIHSIREGEITGTHEVVYNSSIDTISLKHEAHNRKGFALGAVIAAEFVAGKRGVLTMNDLFDDLMKNK